MPSGDCLPVVINSRLWASISGFPKNLTVSRTSVNHESCEISSSSSVLMLTVRDARGLARLLDTVYGRLKKPDPGFVWMNGFCLNSLDDGGRELGRYTDKKGAESTPDHQAQEHHIQEGAPSVLPCERRNA
jgi:hypothetical protein